MRIHRVSRDQRIGFGYSSKLNAEWEFLTMLRDKARQAAKDFLATDARTIWTRFPLAIDWLPESV
ncbi:hypothetical protein [Microvirga sp. VF16]|uniref:hypothetical protein n=1 Tax=Microvirga sp. VF16 TaxID=2807101 RepID=UPI00193CB815|nr:hypothetical protein [Microvirga sp. VF16]QRM27631.1 hypothetical protein JO965_15235 [Microvirga sp. VF16]